MKKKKNPQKSNVKSRRLLDIAFKSSFALAFITVFLTWDHSAYSMFFIIFVLTLGVALYIGYKNRLLKYVKSDLLIITFLFLIAVLPVLRAPAGYFHAIFRRFWFYYGILLLFSLTKEAAFQDKTLFDVIIFPFVFIFSFFLDFFKFSIELIRNINALREDVKRNISLFSRGFVGFIIALPLVSVLIFLLGKLNPVFFDVIKHLWEITFAKIFPSLSVFFGQTFELFFFAAIFFTFLMAFWDKNSIVKKFAQVVKVKSNKLAFKPNWDTVIVTSVLLTLNAVFALFIVASYKYFFVLDSNHNYAFMARRGFIYGVIASAVIYTILLITFTKTKRKALRQKIIFTANYVFALLSGFVVTVSGYYKLLLYESNYGLTTLRLFVHVLYVSIFLFYLIILLLLFIKKNPFVVVMQSAYFILLGIFLFYLLVPTRLFIVRFNYNLSLEGKKFDTEYNFYKVLQGDSKIELTPVIIDMIENSQKLDKTTYKGALLQKSLIENDIKTRGDNWRDFNLSVYIYKKKLANVKGNDLSAVDVLDNFFSDLKGNRLSWNEAISKYWTNTGTVNYELLTSLNGVSLKDYKIINLINLTNGQAVISVSYQLEKNGRLISDFNDDRLNDTFTVNVNTNKIESADVLKLKCNAKDSYCHTYLVDLIKGDIIY